MAAREKGFEIIIDVVRPPMIDGEDSAESKSHEITERLDKMLSLFGREPVK